jgi:MFS family permease
MGGRIADRVRRSWIIFICGLAQVPLYIIYGLANAVLLVIILFAVHGVVYAFMQPAVDSHVASSSERNMRARVQGLYATMGLMGAFAGASGFSPLYSINFRLPLFVMGSVFGICVLIGGSLIRISEARRFVSMPLISDVENSGALSEKSIIE